MSKMDCNGTQDTNGFDTLRMESIPSEKEDDVFNFKPRSYNIKP